jgi:hypothetical protein
VILEGGGGGGGELAMNVQYRRLHFHVAVIWREDISTILFGGKNGNAPPRFGGKAAPQRSLQKREGTKRSQIFQLCTNR